MGVLRREFVAQRYLLDGIVPHNKVLFLQTCQSVIELAHLLQCSPSENLRHSVFLPLIKTTFSLFNFKMYRFRYQFLQDLKKLPLFSVK